MRRRLLALLTPAALLTPVLLLTSVGCGPDKTDTPDAGAADTVADSGSDAGDVAETGDTGDAEGDADAGPAPEPISAAEAFEMVDLFVGSGGDGYGYAALTPAAQMPNGMVKLGPDTSKGPFAPKQHHFSGYHYGDDDVRGFSHTRLVGTGAAALGNLRWLPVATPPDEEPWEAYTALDKETEMASPGRYHVRLPEAQTDVSLTASLHGGLQRFDTDDSSVSLLFDAASTITAEGTTAELTVDGDTIEGVVHHDGDFATRTRPLDIHFSTTIEPAPDSVEVWNASGVKSGATSADDAKAGAILTFDEPDGPIVVRTGISYVDAKQARLHRKRELKDKSFDQVAQAAKKAWLDKLGRIRLTTRHQQAAAIFYTALYNLWRMPTVWQGLDGRYLGHDGEVHTLEEGRHLTDLSMWDTFRTLHPLLVLVDPDLQRDSLKSLVRMGDQTGWIPRWPAQASFTGSMIGTAADQVFAGSKLKGIDGVDYARAYGLLKKSAEQVPPPGSPFSGRGEVDAYTELDYVPAERDESVSRTLEYAWGDWALGNLGEALGESSASTFAARGSNWQNLYDEETGFLRPKMRDGSWADDFETSQHYGRSGPFTEGNAWHWRFYALQQPGRLADTYGGPEAFGGALTEFFEESRLADSGDPMTLIPDERYWHGNEHDLHAAYLFHFTDTPDRVGHWVRRIQNRMYGLKPGGIPGNDDGGTLTAWYVLSALGLYPVAGGDRYLLGSPLFEKIEVLAADGSTRLTVAAPQTGPETAIVESVTLDETPIEGPYVDHGELMGGRLRFDMRK